ncbi:hypothetical protein [Aestuariivivens sediminicola]|uniref:hypothetical protein n=1 Tax=Aestuariivivens sediminicola TaxID=2913560 RepID=UPI001F574242|nr:hypothetical protein [Aestuariivivens sediminicola]
MKIHPIFSKQFVLWWFILAAIIALKVIVVGFNPNGLSQMEGYEERGILFWILGILFCGIIFSAPFYLISRLFLKKWHPNLFMILISIMVVLLLVFSL